jgi:hypothetical protein
MPIALPAPVAQVTVCLVICVTYLALNTHLLRQPANDGGG